MPFLIKCLVLIITAPSISAHADKLAAEWQARYNGLSKVIRSRDFARLKSFVAENYTWVMPDGKTKNRRDSLAEFKELFGMKRITGGERVRGASKKGDHVDVLYDAHWVLVSKENKTSRYHEVGVDTWKRFAGKWEVVRSVDKISEMK